MAFDPAVGLYQGQDTMPHPEQRLLGLSSSYTSLCDLVVVREELESVFERFAGRIERFGML